MGWAEQLPSGLWRAGWRDADGRRRSKSGIKTKPAALRLAGEMESKVRRGETVTAGRCPTWDEWLPMWQRLRVVEASTIDTDGIRIRRHISPKWGDVRLNRITRSDVQAWVNELGNTEAWSSSKDKDREASTLAAGTIERVFGLFAASMNAATLHEDIPITVNPCRGIALPTVGDGHERFLTRGEFDLIAHYLNEPYYTVAQLLVETGMRFGEFAGLHWQRVHLDDGRIDIHETWEPTAGKIKPYTKGKRKRSVPIGPRLQPILEAQIDRQATPLDSCGIPHAGTVRCRSGLVVPAAGGGPFDGKNFGRRQWSTAVELAGVEHVRIHDLRHTYASWLVQGGVPIQEVQKLLGHGSILTTMKYAHLGQSQHAGVLAALT